MKKIVLSILVAGLVAGTSQAQEIRDREPRKHRTMQRHHRGSEFKSLNLSEEQKTKMKALREEHQKKMSELRKKEDLTVKDWKAQMEAERKAHQSQVQGLLTEEQKASLAKARTERKQAMQNRKGQRFNRMGSLNLSEEQSAKMKAEREATAKKMRAIREDKSLQEDAKRKQIRELMEQQRQNMKSILTEEQQKKLEEQRKKRPSGKKTV